MIALKKIALATLSLVVFLGFSEAALRFLDIHPAFSNRFFVFNRNYDYPEVFRRDARLFWRLRESQSIESDFFAGGKYEINSLGLRGPELNDSAETVRIAALGNSCTFGWQVPEDSVYIQIAAQQLRKRDSLPRFQAINAGIPGYTSFQGKRFWESDIKKLAPSFVTIMFAWNDQWPAANEIPDALQKSPSETLLSLVNLAGRLRTYRFLRSLILSASEPPLEETLNKKGSLRRVSPEEFNQNLLEVCESVSATGAIPILLTSPIPALEVYYPPNRFSPLHDRHEQYNLVIRRLSFERRIELIDLAEEFDKRNDLFDDANADPIHFNSRGQALAGQMIAERVARLYPQIIPEY